MAQNISDRLQSLDKLLDDLGLSKRNKMLIEKMFSKEINRLEEQNMELRLEKLKLFTDHMSDEINEVRVRHLHETAALASQLFQADEQNEALLEQMKSELHHVVETLRVENSTLKENLEDRHTLVDIMESKLELTEVENRILKEENRFLQQKSDDYKSRLCQSEEALADMNRKLTDFQSRNATGLKVYDAFQAMEVETFQQKIRKVTEKSFDCSICSELIVVATSLNCMHTFCQYCIIEWKSEKAECPVCRKPITSEFRHHTMDQAIEGLVNELSEEERKQRKRLVAQRQELVGRQGPVLADLTARLNQAPPAQAANAQSPAVQRNTGAVARRRIAEPRQTTSRVVAATRLRLPRPTLPTRHLLHPDRPAQYFPSPVLIR